MSISSDFAVSGSFPGQRPARAPEKSSNFSQTCSMLSQYLKGKGTFGDLSLGMSCGFDGNGLPGAVHQTAVTPASTMNLFPVAKNSVEFPAGKEAPISRKLSSMDLFPRQSGFDSSPVNNSEPETAQMTIFYAGQVIVFNDFPADKAKEVILLASKAGSSPNPGDAFPSSPIQKPSEPTNLIKTSSSVSSNLGGTVQDCIQRPKTVVSDLPIARKASLARFLEKRKDRITTRAPYQASNSTASHSHPKPAESKSWLGLAAQSLLQFEHQL